jgi:hypothetical protein
MPRASLQLLAYETAERLQEDVILDRVADSPNQIDSRFQGVRPPNVYSSEDGMNDSAFWQLNAIVFQEAVGASLLAFIGYHLVKLIVRGLDALSHQAKFSLQADSAAPKVGAPSMGRERDAMSHLG